MLLSLLHTNFGSPFQATQLKNGRNQTPPFLPKQLFPCFETVLKRSHISTTKRNRKGILSPLRASLLDTPVLWAGRICIFYALLKAGLVGSQDNPLISEEKEAVNRRKLVSKWHPTTKGTLKRSYRVPSKSVGQKLLKAIASLLSDDDHFRDATSHKGCQIRRETAHGESVCCNNVRALFDELPTPHLVVEITPFPAGPLTEKDYAKAEKLEKVLRSGASI